MDEEQDERRQEMRAFDDVGGGPPGHALAGAPLLSVGLRVAWQRVCAGPTEACPHLGAIHSRAWALTVAWQRAWMGPCVFPRACVVHLALTVA